jgi:D-proline dehydrogenase
MGIAIIGGGITGLFVAYHLEREGAAPTLFELGTPGARSAHAAGIIEPAAAQRTNTIAFLRRVAHLWRNGTCHFRRVDLRWLYESARLLERPPFDTMEGTLLAMGRQSLKTYETLAQEADDFGFDKRGLLEIYDDPHHFAEQRDEARARAPTTPVEVREGEHGAGGLFFPQVAWVDTDRFVARIIRELRRTSFVRQRVEHVTLEGQVTTSAGSQRFDTVVITSGVAARKLGLPLTGVRGYGWHIRSPTPLDVATLAVDRGIALVPLKGSIKATGGWDFDLGTRWSGAAEVFAGIRRLVPVEDVIDFSEGSRPCTPDGLLTIGRKENVVVANGGFRLGWSFAPAMGREAAGLVLGTSRNDPFLARFCGTLRSGRLA